MNSLEDMLQETLEQIADRIPRSDVPPLRLHPARHRLRRPGGLGRGRWAEWLAPLAAAAAVAAVIIASVTVSGTIGSRQRTGGVSVAAAGLPRYYVALRFSAHSTCCGESQPLLPRTRAVVVSTTTGAVLATISPPAPQDTFVGVTGAADDRTFVLGVQKYRTLQPTRFYLLRINPDGSPGAGPRARLSPLRIPRARGELQNFAVSPQGTSLAVMGGSLHVFNLATGHERTWSRPLACFGGLLLGGANTGAMLSWAADGRHLALACNNSHPSLIGVWLLDTAAPGNSLVKHSRRLVPGPVFSANQQPPWNQVLLTGDGSTVVGVLEVPRGHRPIALSPLQELAEYSARTGKLVRALNRMPVWNYVDFEQVLWSSPSGRTLLVSDTKAYPGKRRAFFLLNDPGLLTGHHFVPLPHWSIDTMAAAW